MAPSITNHPAWRERIEVTYVPPTALHPFRYRAAGDEATASLVSNLTTRAANAVRANA